MDKIPDIVMQCPKCLKRFPFEETYCEACSAMLEPLEMEPPGEEPAAAEEQKRAEAAPVNDEKIEDVRIEALRADIENKFVYALLLEIRQLRRRLSKKEAALSSLREREGGPDHVRIAASAGKVESEVGEIMQKITRLEMTLENLQQKLDGDVLKLSAEIATMERPGIGARFTEKGRYYRMVSSELATKRLLLSVLGEKRPVSALRIRDITRPEVLFPAAAAAAVIFALSLYVYFHNTSGAVSPAGRTVNQSDAQKDTRISRKEVSALLDDIRQANLAKDLTLWKSRYSAGYLAAKGREDDIEALWKKVDFRSLEYRIDSFEPGDVKARATITWYMQFRPLRGGSIRIVAQRLDADFAREDGRLKITAVTKRKP